MNHENYVRCKDKRPIPIYLCINTFSLWSSTTGVWLNTSSFWLNMTSLWLYTSSLWLIHLSGAKVGWIGLRIGKNPKNPDNFGLDLDFEFILSDCWIDTSGLD